VLPSILKAGGKVLKSDIVIDHWAFGINEGKKNRRNKRNARLLQEELAKNPIDPFLMYHLGITYRTLQRPDRAIEQFEKLLTIQNNNMKTELLANTHTFLAQLYLGKNEMELARQHCAHATHLTPYEVFPYYILATIELENRNCQESIKLLKNILESKKTHRDYQHSIDIDTTRIHLDLGNCYYLIEDYDEALMYYEMAVLHNPGSLEINYNLGRCYIQKDQPKSASKWFERALEINPAFEAARQELISCYESVLC
jgi:tetratricopeptide (TPR) repeat protein